MVNEGAINLVPEVLQVVHADLVEDDAAALLARVDDSITTRCARLMDEGKRRGIASPRGLPSASDCEASTGSKDWGIPRRLTSLVRALTQRKIWTYSHRSSYFLDSLAPSRHAEANLRLPSRTQAADAAEAGNEHDTRGDLSSYVRLHTAASPYSPIDRARGAVYIRHLRKRRPLSLSTPGPICADSITFGVGVSAHADAGRVESPRLWGIYQMRQSDTP
ncbi:hypothetical protein C8F04DRAFT_1394839 [Mycena alexandri]|uniref:Uncharacterized protein n=1 Tax=Mycena alexandri TaxID=1745969 RepID=A0AAD6SX72_9AGAR|nr:hypothetical protein C8F04DRAFT_1394839 [Mycena alexandri]